MTPIKAQFLHQHKDKVVYENEIWIGSPSITQTEDGKLSVTFDMPLMITREFIKRWIISKRSERTTTRVLRFLNKDGTILYSLPKKPLSAGFRVFEDLSANIRIEFEASKDEIRELTKIFQK